MIPLQRDPAERYEVARFDSPAESVASYINNLNSHREYMELRQYRAQLRASGVAVSGIKLAEKLTQYSQRRQDYVEELQSLIHFNKLDKLPRTAGTFC
jgi:Bax protein